MPNKPSPAIVAHRAGQALKIPAPSVGGTLQIPVGPNDRPNANAQFFAQLAAQNSPLAQLLIRLSPR